MTLKLQVVGNPIAHSRSPEIHRAFARQRGIDVEYQAVRYEAGEFVSRTDAFRAAGGHGMNITVPFKGEAHLYAAALSDAAEKAGAVNTLSFTDGGNLGDNTDGVGLVRDLKERHELPLKGANILILGAGGATRGVIEPLLGEDPASLTVANRTVAKTAELSDLWPAVQGQALAEYSASPHDQTLPDLIINATSAGLHGGGPLLNPDWLSQAFCYDMTYGAGAEFAHWSNSQGAAVADGLGMLVEQAAESFFIWSGERVQTQPVYEQLRTEIPSPGGV